MAHRSGTGRKGKRVEVRESAAGRELRVDGTFASFYQPGNPVTGSVWDAIAAPILALPKGRERRVLVLGLGGGSAARVVRALDPRARIVGVEFDPEVVRVARREFDLDALDIEIVVGDALEFLREDRRLFDLILEDVFVGEGEGVHKPGWLPIPGHRLAVDRLAPGGLLVSNTLDEATAVSRALQTLFPRVVRIEVDEYDNRIFVGGGHDLDARPLRRAVAESPILRGTLPRLSFRTFRSHHL